MKVNPKTVIFVLELTGAVAIAAAEMVKKYYLELPMNNN